MHDGVIAWGWSTMRLLGVAEPHQTVQCGTLMNPTKPCAARKRHARVHTESTCPHDSVLFQTWHRRHAVQPRSNAKERMRRRQTPDTIWKRCTMRSNQRKPSTQNKSDSGELESLCDLHPEQQVTVLLFRIITGVTLGERGGGMSKCNGPIVTAHVVLPEVLTAAQAG